jgi:hypothetical protein
MVTKQSADWDMYKTSRNRVNITLWHAKAEYYRTKIAHQKNNPKEAWKTINVHLLGRSLNDTIVNELKYNDSNITSTEEIANAFNEYFTNIGPNLANSISTIPIPRLKHLFNLLNLKWSFWMAYPMVKPLVLIKYLVKF